MSDDRINQLLADMMALRYLALSIYAESGARNEILRNFLKATEEAHTHNTFSGSPDSFVRAFDETRRDLVSAMQTAKPALPKVPK